jgi:hypothetical protein
MKIFGVEVESFKNVVENIKEVILEKKQKVTSPRKGKNLDKMFEKVFTNIQLYNKNLKIISEKLEKSIEISDSIFENLQTIYKNIAFPLVEHFLGILYSILLGMDSCLESLVDHIKILEKNNKEIQEKNIKLEQQNKELLSIVQDFLKNSSVEELRKEIQNEMTDVKESKN